MTTPPRPPGRLSRRATTAILAAGAIAVFSSPVKGAGMPGPRAVKVFIVTMFDAEAQPWISALGLTQSVAVEGLSPQDPNVLCNADGVCLVTTGTGKANAAASASAVVFSGAFDLSQAYFIVSGVASIDPAQGTLGSVAWATNIVDFGISAEIDARTLPSGWTTGYLGIFASSPTQKPFVLFGTEVFTLDPSLVAKAVALSKGATLRDDDMAKTCRGAYTSAPASAAPSVVSCDTTSSDTVWTGALLGQRATAWTSLMAGASATYCTAQQEDNATIAALERGASAGLLDPKRIAVLHGAASFDRPPEGQTPVAALMSCGGAGQQAAIDNIVAAAQPLVSAIVSDFTAWQKGPPP